MHLRNTQWDFQNRKFPNPKKIPVQKHHVAVIDINEIGVDGVVGFLADGCEIDRKAGPEDAEGVDHGSDGDACQEAEEFVCHE